MQSPKSSRKQADSTNWGAAKLLNSLSADQCAQILSEHRKDAVADRDSGCVYAAVKTTNGNYPRVQIPKPYWKSLPRDVQDALAAEPSKKGALKVALHQLQWRASGKLLPTYESGNDISHVCKRGMVVCEGTGSVVPHTVKRGCFNAACLRLETHADNLKRGVCAGLALCADCNRVTRVCEHEPQCGASAELEGRFKVQRTDLVSITYTYGDGTTETLQVARAVSAAATASSSSTAVSSVSVSVSTEATASAVSTDH